jgi:hypothetical protein
MVLVHSKNRNLQELATLESLDIASCRRLSLRGKDRSPIRLV